jgi:hypothetical protein
MPANGGTRVNLKQTGSRLCALEDDTWLSSDLYAVPQPPNDLLVFPLIHSSEGSQRPFPKHKSDLVSPFMTVMVFRIKTELL